MVIWLKYILGGYVCLVFCLASFLTNAQDVHFSQFTAAPLIINPGLTGQFDGEYRTIANYRNQWGAISTSQPYKTIALQFDNAQAFQRGSLDRIAYGFTAINDNSGGALNIFKFLGSGAFHKALDKQGIYNVNLGVQVGLVQKSLDVLNLTFPDQYDQNNRIDPTIPSGDYKGGNSYFYPDIAVGAVWYFNTFGNYLSQIEKRVRHENLDKKPTSGIIGVSMTHVNSPKDFFLYQQRLKPRLNIYGESTISINEEMNIKPMFIYSKQRSAYELLVGSYLEFIFTNEKVRNDDKTLTIGASYRFRDAIIFQTALLYKSIQFGFSYDVNVSSLSNATNYRGGIEFSLMYISNPAGKLHCPKFSAF